MFWHTLAYAAARAGDAEWRGRTMPPKDAPHREAACEVANREAR